MIKNNYKRFFVFLFLFISACSQEKAVYFQSIGNSYAIELKQFDSLDQNRLIDLLNEKTFDIHVNKLSDKKEGHTFLMNSTKTKYIIQVFNKKLVGDSSSINIQIFENENGQKRRIINPGSFKFANVIGKLDVERVRKLIVRLTYK